MKEPVYLKPTELHSTPEERAPALRVGFWNSANNSLLFVLWLGSLLLYGLISVGLGWGAVVVLGIPFYIFSERVARKIFSDDAGWSTSQTGFSVKRIMIGVLILSALLLVTFFGAGVLKWK